MEFRGPELSTSGAYTGFHSHFDGYRGKKLGSKKAEHFFTDQRKKEEAEMVNVMMHDREYPQVPPQSYIPGPPGPLHYGVPLSDGKDPGVLAVSHALFGANQAFCSIPIEFRPVFRRRRRGDPNSEWSNAFVTRVDPCECINPEENYTPYEVSRYRDETGRTHTTLDFSV